MNTTSSNTPKRNHRITHRHILMVACALITAGYLLMAVQPQRNKLSAPTSSPPVASS